MVAIFYNDINLDEELFKKVKFIYEQKGKLGLNTEEENLLIDTYLSFTRNGALLNEDDKVKIRKIDEELAILGPQFSKNVTQAINSYQLKITEEADLKGLPKSVINLAKHEAEARGEKTVGFLPYKCQATFHLLIIVIIEN